MAMTQEQLDSLRIEARFLAIESAIGLALRSCASDKPIDRQELLHQIDAIAHAANALRIRDVPPEQSDLISDEVRQVFESVVSFLKSKVEK